MGLTAAKRWAQERAAGEQSSAALPSEPAREAEQPKQRRPRKPKVMPDEP
jgi:hypothetical protein